MESGKGKMTESPQNFSPPEALSETDAQDLLRSLRRKEGSWVQWGQACQALQKAGYNPQTIFEETGFEPTQQNQVIVAGQVYASVLGLDPSEAVQTHFGQKGSDILYELRILSQTDRAKSAALAVEKSLDVDAAHEVAKAVKEFSRLSKPPEGFTDHPGDAIAFQVWKAARQKSDLQERSRLIAKGLRFAHSDTARQQIEQLLVDFSVVQSTLAPRQPVYRQDEDEELPRILPVVGKLPLSAADLQAVPLVEAIEPFGLVKFAGEGAWVAVPGWQVVRTSEDPVVFLADSDTLPTPLPGQREEVLVVVDRALRQWQDDRFYVVEQNGQLQIQWFATAPEAAILGQVVVILRPKKVLDENYTNELWQIDE
ncbi:MAG TPA: RuBisCO accumulation factor 1 [Thermosynechococcaceae cyanobacterium]